MKWSVFTNSQRKKDFVSINRKSRRSSRSVNWCRCKMRGLITQGHQTVLPLLTIWRSKQHFALLLFGGDDDDDETWNTDMRTTVLLQKEDSFSVFGNLISISVHAPYCRCLCQKWRRKTKLSDWMDSIRLVSANEELWIYHISFERQWRLTPLQLSWYPQGDLSKLPVLLLQQFLF